MNHKEYLSEKHNLKRLFFSFLGLISNSYNVTSQSSRPILFVILTAMNNF